MVSNVLRVEDTVPGVFEKPCGNGVGVGRRELLRGGVQPSLSAQRHDQQYIMHKRDGT
jgi:hypothetical protein